MNTMNNRMTDKIAGGEMKTDRQLPLFGLPVLATLICAFFLGLSNTNTVHDSNESITKSTVVRQLSSLPFPRLSATSDVDDVVSEYPAYLRFVVEVGKDIDPVTARGLQQTYDKLRRRDARGAARFLRGLRFEMVQKLEFMGINPQTVTTSSPVMRQWIGRYIKAWHREADEYLFRSIAFRERK